MTTIMFEQFQMNSSEEDGRPAGTRRGRETTQYRTWSAVRRVPVNRHVHAFEATT